jgi:hypothetical protein
MPLAPQQSAAKDAAHATDKVATDTFEMHRESFNKDSACKCGLARRQAKRSERAQKTLVRAFRKQRPKTDALK